MAKVNQINMAGTLFGLVGYGSRRLRAMTAPGRSKSRR